MPYLTIYIFLGLIAVGLNNAFLIIDTEFIIILTIIFWIILMSVALRSSFVQMYFERSMKIFFHYKLVFELNIILLHSLKGIIAYINIGRFWSSSLLNKIFEIIYHLVSSFHNYILFQIWYISLYITSMMPTLLNIGYRNDWVTHSILNKVWIKLGTFNLWQKR